MSVFDLPRLHFAGVATTRLPTGPRSGLVDLATHRVLTEEGPFPAERPADEYHAFLDARGPRFDEEGRPDPHGAFSAAKGCDFEGNGHFSLDAQVLSVETAPGAGGGRIEEDPLVGSSVDVWGHYNPYLRTTVNRARIFDLDPASRWTTALMAGRFGLGRRGRSHDGAYAFTGGVKGVHPPRWVHLDHIEEVGDHLLAPDLRYSAVHQFAMEAAELDWLPGAAGSPAAEALRDAVLHGADGVVVQFALDNRATPRSPNTPARWRVRGTVAPWYSEELRTCPAGRLLVPVAGSPLRHMTVRVARQEVGLNMVSAVRFASRQQRCADGALHRLGPPLGAGDLELRTVATDRLVARVPQAAYLEGAEATSGLVTVDAEPGWCVAEEEGLRLVGAASCGERRTLLTERETTIESDQALVVLQHRSPESDHAVRVPLRSFVRGRPAPVGAVRVRQYHNPRALPGDPVAGGPAARVGDAEPLGLCHDGAAYASQCTVRTDERGNGAVTLRGERAGTCRVLLTAEPHTEPPVDPHAPGSAWTAYDDGDALGFWAGAGALAVRVLPDDRHLDEVPRGEVDFALVQREVFAYYEYTSSFMRAEVFSLADRCKVETYAALIAQMCDPVNASKTYYMPPSRDLSEAKTRLLVAYLRNLQARDRPPVTLPARAATESAITTRGELWHTLKQAATLELAVMLQYLYAAYSLPTYGAGLTHVRRGTWTSRQLELVCGQGGTTLDDGVRGSLLGVAREEMIHFLLVNNIIMAMGEPFHLPVIDFATLNTELPVPLDLALEPLSIGSLQRYIALEQPAASVPVLHGASAPTGTPERRRFTWSTISELYAGIREGLSRVPDLFLVERGRGGGEHHLFLRETIDTENPDYQLEVDDLPSALFAIDVITEQGEGGAAVTAPAPPRGRADTGPAAPAREVSHFHTFTRIGELLAEERVPGPHGRRVLWNPAYPVLRNPSLHPGEGNRTQVTHPTARTVAQLFNRSYHLALQLMAQHFGQQPDASLRRSQLMNASIDVMTGMMRPLAELLVTMDSGHRGRTAGPTFELDAVPAGPARPDVARRAIGLRFAHLAAAARACPAVPEQVIGMMHFYADLFRHEAT
ncbi:ferritin-like domain-containing protein [Streptomyces diacarni]|uniref:ferritin-like domain-containing protein n=1 Tax=Streptomyces diacarni TaxID=2800381 RepID=UPI0033F492D1